MGTQNKSQDIDSQTVQCKPPGIDRRPTQDSFSGNPLRFPAPNSNLPPPKEPQARKERNAGGKGPKWQGEGQEGTHRKAGLKAAQRQTNRAGWKERNKLKEKNKRAKKAVWEKGVQDGGRGRVPLPRPRRQPQRHVYLLHGAASARGAGDNARRPRSGGTAAAAHVQRGRPAAQHGGAAHGRHAAGRRRAPPSGRPAPRPPHDAPALLRSRGTPAARTAHGAPSARRRARGPAADEAAGAGGEHPKGQFCLCCVS